MTRKEMKLRDTFVTFLCLLPLLTPNADAACTFPSDWTDGSTWYSSNGGSLTFNSSSLDSFSVYTFGSMVFSCDLQDGTKYISKSDLFYRFGLPLNAWLCMDVTQKSSNKYVYYQPTAELADAGNIRMKIYLQGKTITNSSEICDVTDYSTLPYHLMVKSGTISTEKVTCPSDLQSNFIYSYDTGSGDVCNGDSGLDVCTDTSKLTFNYTACSQVMAYSTGGIVNCVYTYTSGSNTFVNVYNLDSTTDESTTYRFSCYSIFKSGDIVYATEYPQDCLAGQNATDITSPGAVIQFNVSSSCESTTTTATTSAEVASAFSIGLIIGLVLALIIIIVLIIILYICFYLKKKEKQRKQKEKEEEEARLRALEEGLIDGKLPDDVIPNMNLGLPDESKYDLERLMLPEIITPSYIRPDINKEKHPKIDHDFPDGNIIIGEDFFEEMEMQEMVDAKEFMSKRQRFHEMDEFDVGSSRASSAVKRLKELEREKKKRRRRKRKRRKRKRKGKGGFDSDTSIDMTDDENEVAELDTPQREHMTIYLDRIGETDEFSEEFDPSRTPTAERKTRFRDDSGIDDNIDEDFKKLKKKKKKKRKKSKKGAKGESKDGSRKGSKGTFGIKWDAPFAPIRKSRKVDPMKKLGDFPVFRDDPKYKDLPTLQRIHRKKNPSLWNDLFGNLQEMSPEDQAKFRKKMNENWWKKLLGELYTDKKYFDYVRASSKSTEGEDPSGGQADEGLNYLYDRACFWESQRPIPPRPTTYGSIQGRQSPRARRRVPVESIIPRTPMTQMQRDRMSDDDKKNDKIRRETTM